MAFSKKKEKLEQKLEQQQIPQNGNGKTDVAEKLRALKESGVLDKFQQQMNQQQEEKTKYTVLHDLSSSDNDKIKMHTELDIQEIFTINKLEMWMELAPRVFGNSEKNREIIGIVGKHVRGHRLNKMSFGRKREYSLVHAVRGDNTVTQTESAIQKVFKYK